MRKRERNWRPSLSRAERERDAEEDGREAPRGDDEDDGRDEDVDAAAAAVAAAARDGGAWRVAGEIH